MAAKSTSRRRLGAGDAVSLIVNALVHAIILSAIWAGLYQFLIGPLARNALGNELHELIDDMVAQNISNVPVEAREYIKNSANEATVQRLMHLLEKETKASQVQNAWLSGMSYAVPVVAALILGGLIGILYLVDVQLPLWHILTENLITFTLVGAVEIVLFLFIAIKYVPVKASTLTDTIVARAKFGLNCA